MSNDFIQASGSLSKTDAMQKLADDIFARIKNLLTPVSNEYRQEFVKNALTERGPASLGQVTGNLAASFTAESVSNQGPIGSIRAFIPPGETFFYGQAQDQRKGWFQHGADASQESVIKNIEAAVNKAVQESNK